MRRAQAHGGSSPSASADVTSSSPARSLGRYRVSYVCGGKGFLNGSATGLLGRVFGIGPKTEGEEDKGRLQAVSADGAGGRVEPQLSPRAKVLWL